MPLDLSPPMMAWAASALVAAAALLLGILWLFHRRPWAGPRTRYPVVLAHGIFGFQEIEIGGSREKYFRGIPERLEGLGLKVYTIPVPKIASVAKRAQVLADGIRGLPERKVNIIAHSMGGLDARYAISRLGVANRVSSLTTIGTPHRGTPIADLASSFLGEKLMLKRLLDTLGVDGHAMFDLTTERAAQFNREVEDRRGIGYSCVLAEADADRGNVNTLLAPSNGYLNAACGPNDGLIPVSSQAWGNVLLRVNADHWAQIGWGDFDAPALYEELVRRLRRQGH